MSKKLIIYSILPLLLLFWNGTEIAQAQSKKNSADASSGTLQKMIVANGVVTMNVDLKRLGSGNGWAPLQLTVAPDSFFTVLVFNNELRGPLPSSMTVTPRDGAKLAAPLRTSANQLIVEKRPSDEAFDLVVRDSKSNFTFFNIDGHHYSYDASKHLLKIDGGRVHIAHDLAQRIGRPSDAGTVVGSISIAATLYPIEISELVNGNVTAAVLPPLQHSAGNPDVGTLPGPDVIVGDLPSMDEPSGGSSGTQVGLEIGTTSCNNGQQPLDWFALPSNDHPVIPQNFYRMSGGAANTERFEQVGQSWLKHAFEALENNACSFGCVTSGCTTGTHLCSGCSDPYSAGLNGSQSGLGSRAWVNPFTGFYPGSNPNPADHTGHTHTGTSHRILVNVSDLNTTLNAGATYFAEGQYVTPHEYAWCQANPTQCNMYNNVSYRQFSVSGTTSFTFSAVAATVRTQPAIMAWIGAAFQQFKPAPGIDGIGILGYKVTNPSAGVWHYEYAIYNENLDRAVQSFGIPLGNGITISNVGFHAPPQEPGWANDGTQNNQGFSSTPWTPNQTATNLTWSCETFAQNQNANAIRWGTLYNFRFDANKPPTNANATLGFFKTGAPITVGVQAPMPQNPLQLTSVVSRKTHGSAGDFDVDLPLGGSAGVECRITSGNHTFVFTFTNNVVSGNASVTSGTGTVSGSPVFSGNTMTVNLTGVSDQQQITVTISNVMDTFGQTLPDTAVDAVILAGDTNGNRTVNAADVAQTKAQQGAVVDQTNFRTDVNANGTINAADTAVVKANAGHSVP
jgi:hypothetical protein